MSACTVYSSLKKYQETGAIKKKLQHISIQLLISYEVVSFWKHTLYPASYSLMEEFLEPPFLDSKQVPLCILLDFFHIFKSCPFQVGFYIWKEEKVTSDKIWKTDAQAMVTDGNSVVWWNNLTLDTFLQITAINNRSEQERYNLMCIRNKV